MFNMSYELSKAKFSKSHGRYLKTNFSLIPGNQWDYFIFNGHFVREVWTRFLLIPSEKLHGFIPVEHQGVPIDHLLCVCTAHHSQNSAVGPYSLGYIHCVLASVENSSVQAAGFASSRTIFTLSIHSSEQTKNFAKIKPKIASCFRL